jgi:hypothetical protein
MNDFIGIFFGVLELIRAILTEKYASKDLHGTVKDYRSSSK